MTRRTVISFTLLELMVALTIATMILGAAANVTVTTLKSWEQGRRTQDQLQLARTTCDLIERHLRSAVPPKLRSNLVFWGEDLSADGEIGHRMTFISTAQGRFPREAPMTDTSEVAFELDPSEGEGFKLRIDSTPDDDPSVGGYQISFSEQILAFSAFYYDGTEWVEEWDGDELPQAVEFTLVLADPLAPTPEAAEAGAYRVTRLIAMPLASPQAASGEAPGPGESEQPDGQPEGASNPESGGPQS